MIQRRSWNSVGVIPLIFFLESKIIESSLKTVIYENKLEQISDGLFCTLIVILILYHVKL